MALSVSELLPSTAPRRQIWSVGGGKGGIGKSLLAASIGWQLARMGKRVVLVDADLGGANLHTCLGLSTSGRTLADFIQRRVATIQDVLVEVGRLGLSLISGASDLLSAANIKHAAEGAGDEPRPCARRGRGPHRPRARGPRSTSSTSS